MRFHFFEGRRHDAVAMSVRLKQADHAGRAARPVSTPNCSAVLTEETTCIPVTAPVNDAGSSELTDPLTFSDLALQTSGSSAGTVGLPTPLSVMWLVGLISSLWTKRV